MSIPYRNPRHVAQDPEYMREFILAIMYSKAVAFSETIRHMARTTHGNWTPEDILEACYDTMGRSNRNSSTLKSLKRDGRTIDGHLRTLTFINNAMETERKEKEEEKEKERAENERKKKSKEQQGQQGRNQQKEHRSEGRHLYPYPPFAHPIPFKDPPHPHYDRYYPGGYCRY
ncbi:hypothetical protein ACLMJK_000533 [Lecanora helva]